VLSNVTSLSRLLLSLPRPALKHCLYLVASSLLFRPSFDAERELPDPSAIDLALARTVPSIFHYLKSLHELADALRVRFIGPKLRLKART
jgi:hypothetical protein